MTDQEFLTSMTEDGYTHLRRVPTGQWIGLLKQLYSTGLFVDLKEFDYHHRYCYDQHREAVAAIEAWDGEGDPPGPWVKRKGVDGERLGPGTKEFL